MKKNLFLLMLLFTCSNLIAQSFNYQRSWGTYFGDERFTLKDSEIDKEGNLYIVGFVYGDNGILPSFSSQYSSQPSYGGGSWDGFLAKFNSQGNLLWATYVGGAQNDMLHDLDVDQNNNVYVIGNTNSEINIATPNVSQTIYGGNGDMFISKYSFNGNKIWCTYFGNAGIESNDFLNDVQVTYKQFSIVHDQANNFYVTGLSFGDGLGTSGVFQPNRETSVETISKFDDFGNRIWTTYYSNNGSKISTIYLSSTGLYVTGKSFDCQPSFTFSNYYGTPTSYQPLPNNCSDVFLTKFSLDGQRIWSTYYGGTSFEFSSPKSVLFYQTKIYLAGLTNSTNNITTSGAHQEANLNSGLTPFLVQMNEDGTRNWATCDGLNQPPGGGSLPVSNISASNGDIYMCGTTALTTNIATIGAYKSSIEGYMDGYISKFTNNGEKIWGTYYGGEDKETLMFLNPYQDKFYLAGMTSSFEQMTTTGSYQEDISIFSAQSGNIKNIFIAHFEPNTFSNITFDQNSFSIYPNPSNGNFTVAIKNGLDANCKLELYDVVGKKIHQQNISTIETYINTNGLSNGIYLLKLTNNLGLLYNTKIIIE